MPEDLIHLGQGTIVPADVRVCDGSLLVDQSALTGESAVVQIPEGKTAYAGALVRGGRAAGHVHARRGARLAGVVEVRRAGDTRERVARHRLDDRVVQ